MASRRPLVNVSGDVSELPAADYTPGLTKSISIQSPTNAEKIPLFYTPVALTITEIRGVVKGSSTPQATCAVRSGSDFSLTGTSNWTGAVSSTTTGSTGTIVNSAVAANSWVWLETSALNGTVDLLHVTVRF